MCIETKLSIADKSQCVPGRPLLTPTYGWPGLEDPVRFNINSSYMAVYNAISNSSPQLEFRNQLIA
jgi:hypothetical protein